MNRCGSALLVLAMALAACSKSSTANAPQGTRHPWTHPGVLTYAENGDPESLNPVINASSVVGDLSMFIFSYAVRYDDKAEPVPDAVSEIPTIANGDVSKDGLTLKYKLRHNIKWQDGYPLRCNDLRFTWQLVMNPKTNISTTDGYKDIRDIDCSDPYVAVVHMKKLYAPFLQQLWGVNGNAPILPEHLLAKYNSAGTFNTAPYNALPIGSGPFRVVEWRRGTAVRMVANPSFFLGKPKLKEVIFKIMPDVGTMLTQLQTHEVDMIASGSGLQWPQYQQLAANPAAGIVAMRNDSFIYDHIDFNLKRPVLADRQVRVALAYATNRNEIIDKVLHGSGFPSDSPEHPVLSWGYTDNTVHYPFDLQKAKQTLDADGWKIGLNGIRMKNGQRLTFNLSTQTESNAGRVIETLLQREWRDAGVQANVKNYPTASMFMNGNAGILEGGKYDAALYAWSGAADPDLESLYSAKDLAPRGQNSMFWVNQKATAALEDALTTVDQARRKQDYIIVQEQLALDVPTIIIDFRKVPFVYNSDLKNFKPSPVISPFWNPWTYSI